jgi:hypothetical protein
MRRRVTALLAFLAEFAASIMEETPNIILLEAQYGLHERKIH